MKRKIISFFTIIAIVITGTTYSGSTNTISANKSLEEIQKQIEDLKKQKSQTGDQKEDISDEKAQTQAEIEANRAEQKRINAQIKVIDTQLANTQENLRQKEVEITETEAKIEQLNVEIAEMEERIAKREGILKDRLRTLQKQGGNISYLEVIMGSKSFGDFLDRTTAVTKVMDQDKQIMQKQIEDKIQLETKMQEVEEKKANLERQKADLEALKVQLDEQRKEKDRLMKELQIEEKKLEQAKLDLEEQERILRNQIKAIQKLIQQSEKEKERIKQLSQASSAGFIRPALGPVTSHYGPRWGAQHYGIDIGKRERHVPIVAAAGGVVTESYYSSSYGNVVFLSHLIDGQVYTTVYAHLENREVSEMDVVQQGQRLGYMGNTGHSTGPHLHFEVHVGPWTADKRNAVDPRKYVNF